MSEQKLAAELRTDFGKGAARQARRANKIPAVIYGHGADPIHVLLPAKATTLAVRQANALLSIDLDGESHLALAKDIQRNPIKQIVEHIDLLTVQRGEKVQVDVNIHVEGEPEAGVVTNLEQPTVTVEAEATHLPESLTVNIEGHKVGEHVHASDIKLPNGVTLLTDAETVIVNVTAPVVADLGEEAAEGETTVDSDGGEATAEEATGDVAPEVVED
ncbi:50S ribosomal protein L25/general stress protein Ctc [Arthrobacter sp. JZ12]|uniref:50S ribosomal protein L25/general stress protein Ctc n=1 Tax=Arthrobacter sp. JZ12 TaxID=2654190 RepID=UPI002B46AC62|nr:50S ribosomal protein L25/general stress protein Ctc [Arthrobacter sp. JZ12]WRH24456.1 50S ribosomal protein L25/general stress protein Ctc [Arthrobacter sp. JZ12]